MEIARCMGIEATDDAEGRVVMLGFCRQGVAVLLTYQDALELGRALRRLGRGAHQTTGGTNGHAPR